jgi:cellulose synthase operon protein C
VKNAYEPSAEEIQALVDGELPPETAARVRAALVDSPGALAELDHCLQVAALAHALRQQAPGGERWVDAADRERGARTADVVPLRRPVRRRPQLVIAAMASLVGAAAALILWLKTDGSEDGRPVVADAVTAFAGALAPTRAIEARLSWPGADRYRPYDTARAGSAQRPAETLSFDLLARIEKLGDPRATSAARLLVGQAAQAASPTWPTRGKVLGGIQPARRSADVASDRAAIALVSGKPEQAVLAAAAALESDPRHVQATWNRALALERLGMPLTAADAFAAVAARGEKGWSQEASERSAALRAQFERRKAAWKAANQAGVRLVAGGTVDDDTVNAYPSLVRLYFYDAVRAAPSAERVRALRPLAQALDARHGGDHLAAYIDRIARADFRRRAPLAARYAVLARRQLTDQDKVQKLIRDLRASRQDDMLLGALLHAGPIDWRPNKGQLDEYVRLARATRDPWFELEAEINRAWHALSGGDAPLGQTVLSAAAPRCENSAAIDRLCVDAFRLLTHAYVLLHRPEASRRALSNARRFAGTSGNLPRESELLFYSYLVSAVPDDTSASLIDLSTAFLDEWSRQSEDCADVRQAHEWKAITLINRNRLDEARREIAVFRRECDAAAPTNHEVFLRAQLLRPGGDDEAVRELRRDIAARRLGPDVSAGDLLFLDYVEGLLLVDRAPEEGRGLLRRAIAGSAEAAGDVTATKARLYSYSVLVEDSAARGAYGDALALMAEQRGLPTPTRCALGAQSELASSVFVARGADGREIGAMRRREPDTPAGSHAVPDAITKALEACELVEVLAGQPYYGRPLLLPRSMTWEFRTGSAPRRTASRSGAQVVVANIVPPAGLGLAPLWPIPDAPGATLLEGAAATPERVLAAAARASLIEIHAHGLLAAEGEGGEGADTSLLVLAPDARGRYALSGTEIRRTRLHGAPIVVLAACNASDVGGAFHSTWGLADAFIEAGASAVIASPDPIQDAGAFAFFAALRSRIAGGEAPAAALRAERIARANGSERTWIDRLVVFR